MNGVGTSVNEVREAAKILGLSGKFDEQEARQAYSVYVRRWHPDVAAKQGLTADEANKRMIEGNKAYAVVKNALSENGGAYDVSNQDYKSASNTTAKQTTPPRQSRARQTQANDNTGSRQRSQTTSNGTNEGGTRYWDAQEQQWKTDPTGQRSGWYDGEQQQQHGSQRQTVNQNGGTRRASTSSTSGSNSTSSTTSQGASSTATSSSTTSSTSSSSSSGYSGSVTEDMVDSTMTPVSDVDFKYESFPAKILHVILTLVQAMACFRVVANIFAYLVPAQADSVNDVAGHVLSNLWPIAIGVIGAFIGGFINLWLTRVVARFLMKHANNHAIIAVILDAILIWLMAQAMLSVLPAETIQQVQDVAKSVAPNLGT